MTDSAVKIETDKLAQAPSNASTDDMSLEALLLLIHADRLKTLRDQAAQEFEELNDRQEKVKKLHDALEGINNATGDKGNLEVKNNPDLQELLSQAKDVGVDIDLDKKKYSKEERDRLVDNLKMKTEDLNVKNNMQLDVTQRLHTERLESFQMARSIIKPLDDDKRNKARKMAGG